MEPNSKERRRQLVEEYMDKKLPMGIIGIRNIETNRTYVISSIDIPSKINMLRFQLELGSFMCKSLQKDWNTLGSDKFVFETLESLEHDKDGIKKDYKDDLKVLLGICLEKLKEQKVEIYV